MFLMIKGGIMVGSKANKSAYIEAGILSKATFWWVLSIFTTAYKRPLTPEDVPEPPDFSQAEYNHSAFIIKWHNLEEKQKARKASLLWLVYRHYHRQILSTYILYLLTDISRFLIFVTVKHMVIAIESHTSSDQVPLEVWILLVVMCFLHLLSVFSYQHGVALAYRCDLRIKLLLSTLIYRKIFKLSKKAFQEANSGHIISLLSADIEAFHLGVDLLSSWINVPIITTMVLVYQGLEMGSAIVVALGVIIVATQLQYRLGVLAGKLRLKQAGWTDKRVLQMNEIIKAMKVIKMYCWEKFYANRAQKFREQEMRVHFRRSTVVTVSMIIGYPVVKLMVYLVVTTHFLTGNSTTFVQSISLLGVARVIEYNAFRFLGWSFISYKEMVASSSRIKKFLMMEDQEENDYTHQTAQPEQLVLEFSSFSGKWPDQEEEGKGFCLNNISFRMQKDEAVGLIGKVGAGKSTLLHACLRELVYVKGLVTLPNTIAYAPQEPWIMSETIRDNILMGEKYDEERYEKVIRSCALTEDLDRFPHGDKTVVGERGLTLSGGQKARVGLARAVYQEADLYLLDDPLSAVDGKIANIIFFECINGLLKDKARIIATHQLQFVSYLDRVLLLKEGTLIAEGHYSDMADAIKQNVEAEEKENCDDQIFNLFEEDRQDTNNDWSQNTDMLVDKEDKNESGGVASQVYLRYVRAGQGIILVPLFLTLYALSMGIGVYFDWLLVSSTTIAQIGNATEHITSGNVFMDFFEPTNLVFKLSKSLGVLVALIFIIFITAFVLLVVFFTLASYNLYNKMFAKLLKAPSYFFETRPVGHILNRFSRDTTYMDIHLIMPILVLFFCSGNCLPDLVYVLIANPWCSIAVTLYVVFLVVLYKFGLPAIRDTRRLEASMRSPIYSHVSSTLDGLTVIKAMKKENMFLKECNTLMDLHSISWYNFICCERALMLIVDVMSSLLLVVSFIALLLDYDRESDDQSTMGLTFVYLPAFLINMVFVFSYIAIFVTMMTSVERVQQYSKLEQEAPDYEAFRPPAHWPHKGQISFKDVTITYRGQKKPALGPLNFTIQSGEKIGVVGRTGAGKSSLFVTLLRMVEPEGEIKIDGINIKDIGLTDLRSNMAIIPQDPVLFNHTIRLNLDPFDAYQDEELWVVLEKVQLKGKLDEMPGQLEAKMGESGNNFSVGEKQLLCLARAVLKKSTIVLIDEATANVDNRTDAIIQRTLHESLSEATVITIAHRLDTLRGSDKIVVLEEGMVVELDHPYNLLQNQTGAFYKMVETLGPDGLKYFQDTVQSHKHKTGNGSGWPIVDAENC